jgi:hypothetical protein
LGTEFKLYGATFKEDVYIKNNEIGIKGFDYKCEIDRCTFEQNLVFEQNESQIDVHFRNCTFHQEVDIDVAEVTTPQTITITDAQLKKDTLISVHFPPNGEGEHTIIFDGLRSQVEGTKIIVYNCTGGNSIQFLGCYFNTCNVKLVQCNMNSVVIGKTALSNNLAKRNSNWFTGFVFDHCTWSSRKGNCWTPNGVYIAGEETHQNIIEAKLGSEVYRWLKNTTKEAGEAQVASSFHFWHQYFKLERETKGKLRSWSWSFFYLLTSCYGVSWRRPLAWFGLTILSFTVIYQLSFPYCFWDSLSISFFSSLPLFGGKDTIIGLYGIPPTGYSFNARFWGLFGFQSLIQSYFVFQIGSAIRNKVRQ